MKRFVLASNNEKKLRELGQILERMGLAVISQQEAGIHTNPEETGKTFEENARIKARAACEASGLPAVADDSGLEVEALGGAPGIFSARYCPGSDEDRVAFLLKNMSEIPQGRRQARFVSAIACVFPDGRELCCRGECPGEILNETRGAGRFGYDPVFYLPEEGLTFAEIPQELKNKISHRAKALERFSTLLENMMKSGEHE
ncbi:RdgB/HAM1 family non-canonical purine NTP pyrophosphatase [Acidaminobacterium chupaoyuni]